jgi:hypothetical protein
MAGQCMRRCFFVGRERRFIDQSPAFECAPTDPAVTACTVTSKTEEIEFRFLENTFSVANDMRCVFECVEGLDDRTLFCKNVYMNAQLAPM